MGNREACDECRANCSLFHGSKKDPSSLVTTFHKILFGVYDYSKDLCLPQKISQTIPVLAAGQDHVLEDTNGQHWQVTLGTKDGHLAFRKGWDKFFADHGLREGYILAFHYRRKYNFVVQIIDNTGFEKFKFPIANRKKRKRSTIDENGKEVGECHNHSNNSNKKQGSAFSGGISESEGRIHGQPMSKDKPSSLESGNGIYQQVASADGDLEQVFMINRDAGYKYEEDRSPLLDFINSEMKLRVDHDGSIDKRTRPNTLAECNAVADILDENLVSAKVVSGEQPAKVAAPTFSNNADILDENLVSAKVMSGEQPAKVAAPTFSNNNNVHLKRENVAEVVNDLHGDRPCVVPIENRAQLHSEYTIKSSTTLSKRVKVEEAAGSKKHSSEMFKAPKAEVLEFGKSPSCEFMSPEKYPKFKDRPDQKSGRDEKSNEVRKKVKSEPVDSFNDERLDVSALSFTVMVVSSEHLELPTSVTLWAHMDKKVVNLKGPDKRIWPVLYCHKLGVKALTSGWKNFFMLYRLRIGDECAFMLENEAETVFRIDVKRK